MRYRSTASPLEIADLISAGNLGLIRAIEKYDSSKDNLFSTYATHWIKRNQDRLAYNN
jgi:RNA polymerase primary sigma factor